MSEVRVLHVLQRFDFSQHKTFTEQYSAMQRKSCAKKSLWTFRAQNIYVSVKGAKDNARDILLIANFEKLFEFE